MAKEQALVETGPQQLRSKEVSPSEKDLLIEILKLQLKLNSKMFEFIRGYQQEFDYSRDRMMFRNGSGGTTKLARLKKEINELGIGLGKIAALFIGEDVYEKRDDGGNLLLYCKYCKEERPYAQLIDRPYGLSGAYMDGTERLECMVCKKDTVYPGDPRLPKFNSIFRTK